MDTSRFLDWADHLIVDRSLQVVFAFLVMTAIFAVGLGNVETEAGTEQFAEEVPAQEALESINTEFSPTFSTGGGSTQLIQTGENVVSKQGMLRMLRAQEQMSGRESLRVAQTSSAAAIVAQTINPNATTLEAQIRTIERAPPSEIRTAVRTAAERPGFTGLLSNDFNPSEPSASATIAVVQHNLPIEFSQGAGTGGADPLTNIQLQMQRIADQQGGDIRVFGSGIISDEFSSVIFDSLIIVIPAAVVFIVFFLIFAYRDLADLLLGVVSLGMAIVWTFGFMGLAGISFNQILIAVPPLLLAVGIDFGIHAVNRYREERVEGKEIDESMLLTTDQLLVAFFIVTTTTVIGFMSNLTSQLLPIRDFGIVASVGIIFTFFVFGIFLPAAKVSLDRARKKYPIPTFSQTPLGQEGSRLGRVLSGGVFIARRAPRAFLVLMVLLSLGSAYYATGIDTSFTQEEFLPPEETPVYLSSLPEPFKPSDYTIVGTLNFLEDNFEASQDSSVTIYIEGAMERDIALEMIHRGAVDPPDAFIRDGRRAEGTSIVTIVQQRAQSDPDFAALVARNDRDGNGIPDDNVDEIYDYLLSSSSRAETLRYLSEDRRSARAVYSVKSSASQEEIAADGEALATQFRYTATATGGTIVFQAISDLILQSAIVSLAVALGGTVIFLMFIFWLLEGRASLGIANVVPIVITVAMLAGTMRYLGISFNAFTATILAITIGLGIDYSVHVVHRFVDELEEQGATMPALERTVRGTGGALTGSMFTTVFGIGVLFLSVFPAIGQFGTLTALSVVYSFIASMVILPSTLVVWDRYFNRGMPTEATAPKGVPADD
ncbi:RND family transporter [Haladaptatus sp. DYSN1]|uniref:efflux RND transporter permease subunit n=1 Tax=unclassified Haladaptatus TaxID=2622732 RepID=UPI00240680A8|nr:MMPL family transporter [Haladaptatus sp. DYSN1]